MHKSNKSLVSLERYSVVQVGRDRFSSPIEYVYQTVVVDIVSLLADGRVISNRLTRRLDPLGQYERERSMVLTTWRKGKDSFIHEYFDKNAGWAEKE